MSMFNSVIVKVMPIFPKSFIGIFSQKYIAGETLEDAIAETKKLNSEKLWTTMDVLGENISRLEEAEEAKKTCLNVLDEIYQNKIHGNISIKLTQMGLNLDKYACEDNVSEIIERARRYNNFVRIDMEDATCTDDTIDICLKMHKQYPKVGTVIQAYLKRSEEDVKALAEKGINLRICKGIYDEAPAIAYKDKEEIRQNFMRLIEIMMDKDVYLGIATHDPVLIEKSLQQINQRRLNPDQYEFQMLLGVAEKLRNTIIQAGHNLRVYVPFGEHWYAYSVRRLKENPQIAGYVIKNLFKQH